MLRYIMPILYFMAFLLVIAAKRQDEEIFSDRQSLESKENADASLVSSSRGIAEFGLMILCGTKRNPFDYVGYGCWCGLGGKGTPVDDTDRCCKVHDECYSKVQKSGDCPFGKSIYVMPYSRKGCYGCEPADWYWFYGKCRNALCECDSVAVQCFMRSKYNQHHKKYPSDRC